MQPGNPRDLAVVLVSSLATVLVALSVWLGPVAFGVRLISNGTEVVGDRARG